MYVLTCNPFLDVNHSCIASNETLLRLIFAHYSFSHLEARWLRLSLLLIPQDEDVLKGKNNRREQKEKKKEKEARPFCRGRCCAFLSYALPCMLISLEQKNWNISRLKNILCVNCFIWEACSVCIRLNCSRWVACNLVKCPCRPRPRSRLVELSLKTTPLFRRVLNPFNKS